MGKGKWVLSVYSDDWQAEYYFFKQLSLAFLPTQLVYIFKCYTGLAWFCWRGRTRQAYVKFYRTSLTFNMSVIAVAMELQLISFAETGSVWQKMGRYQWFYVAWYVSEIFIIDLYMRHLD